MRSPLSPRVYHGPEMRPRNFHLGREKGSMENVAGPSCCNSTALMLLVEGRDWSMDVRPECRDGSVCGAYHCEGALTCDSPEMDSDYTSLSLLLTPDVRDRCGAKVDRIGMAMTDLNCHSVGLKRYLTCSTVGAWVSWAESCLTDGELTAMPECRRGCSFDIVTDLSLSSVTTVCKLCLRGESFTCLDPLEEMCASSDWTELCECGSSADDTCYVVAASGPCVVATVAAETAVVGRRFDRVVTD